MSTVAKQVGFTMTPFKNQGNVTEWQQGIESAKSLGDSLVDLFAGPTPTSLSAQIKDAQGQGVKVVTSSLVDINDKMNYVDANLGNDYVLGGQLEADWAISKQGDKTNALVVVAEEIPSTQDMENGIKQEFAQYAPNAKYKFLNEPLTDWSTKIQPDVQNALLADPSINYVIAIYDSMTQYIVPAVDITNNTGKVKIIGFNGTPFALIM
jgi:ribose transport system substrate-binding protein